VNDTTTESSTPSTGDAAVDAALERLDELETSDLGQHVGIYEDIQRSLGSVLDGTTPGDASRQ
jgi:hypothetical protein